ncbi:MAG: hypothetical protein ABWW69_01965 [Pyrodictiaceae archaeon]
MRKNLWFLRGRSLVLVATPKPKNIERAIEELGDALYSRDPEVIVQQCTRKYSTICVYSRALAPREAFREVVQYPPAYIERVIPAEYHAYATYVDLALTVGKALREIPGLREIGLELHIRSRLNSAILKKILSRVIHKYGLRIRYRASKYIIVETIGHMAVISIVDRKHDRLSFWRSIALSKGLYEPH